MQYIVVAYDRMPFVDYLPGERETYSVDVTPDIPTATRDDVLAFEISPEGELSTLQDVMDLLGLTLTAEDPQPHPASHGKVPDGYLYAKDALHYRATSAI